MADIHGSLVSVTARTMGDTFAVAASIGATTLFLDDVSDFDEDGGSVSIAGTVYAYDSADMEADTIHLTTTLTAAAAVGDAVDIWDPDESVVVSDRLALVSVDGDDGDPVGAVLDHSLTPLLIDSTLAFGQSVSLTPDGAGYRVTEVHGKNNKLIQRTSTVAAQMGVDDSAGNVYGIVVTPSGAIVRAATLGDFRVKTPDGATYLPCLASAFTVSSDSALKTKPTKAPDALGIIAAAPAKHWRYLTDDKAVKRVGPMADDLPEWAREVDPEDGTLGVDLARMCGLLWTAVGQLSDRINELEKGD